MSGLWLGTDMEGRRFELPISVGTQAIAILAKRGAGKSWTAGVLDVTAVVDQVLYLLAVA